MAKDVKKIAADVFKRFPDSSKCFITSDGGAFLNENSAKLHANKNASGKKLTVTTFSNPNEATADNGEAEGVTKLLSYNTKDFTAAVASVGSQEDLDTLEKGENTKKKPRKGVLEAIALKRAELAPTGGDKNDTERKNEEA